MSDLSPVTGCGHQCRSYVDRRDNRVNHHVNKDAKRKLLVRLPFLLQKVRVFPMKGAIPCSIPSARSTTEHRHVRRPMIDQC
jgi:hypothetical protein